MLKLLIDFELIVILEICVGSSRQSQLSTACRQKSWAKYLVTCTTGTGEKPQKPAELKEGQRLWLNVLNVCSGGQGD
jgi:hypothetical protein